MLKIYCTQIKKLSKKGCENFSHYIFIQKATSKKKIALIIEHRGTVPLCSITKGE